MELDMTKGTPWKLMLKFIYPIILGNIFQQFYTMVDTAIVGKMLGVNALAAVGAVGSLTFLILGFTQGMCMGFTVITSQRFGAGDYEGMRKSIAMALVLGVIETVIVSFISCYELRNILLLINIPENIIDMSYDYLFVLCSCMVCCNMYNLLASILRAVGNSKVPLFFLILSAVLNIFLDVILVGKIGVAGAAWATVLAQGISAALCALYIVKKVPLLHLNRKHWEWDNGIVANQLKIGIPMALETCVTATGCVVMQAALNTFGSIVVAGFSASCRYQEILTAPMYALGTTAATYSAQNRGINATDRIKTGAWSALIMCSIYSIVIYGVEWVTMPYAMRIFVSENVEEVITYANTYGRICGAFFIALGMIFIYRSSIQGCGFAALAIVGGIFEFIGRIIASRIAMNLHSFEGVCAADPAAWVLSGVFLFISFFFVLKKMEREKQTA